MEQLVTAPLDFGIGLYQGEEQRRQAARAKRDMLAGIGKAEDQYNTGYDAQKGMYDPYLKAGAGAVSNRSALEEQLNPDAYRLNEMGEFDGELDINKFLDPSMDYAKEQMNSATEGSAASAGGLLSGKTLKALNKNSNDLALGNWNKATGHAKDERTFNYGDYLNKFNSSNANIQDKYKKNIDKYGRNEDVATTGYNATGNVANFRGDLTGQLAGSEMDRANVNAQSQFQNSMMSDALGGLSNLASGLTEGGMGAYSQFGGLQDVGSMGMGDFNANSATQFAGQQANPYGIQTPNHSLRNTMDFGSMPPPYNPQFPSAYPAPTNWRG